MSEPFIAEIRINAFNFAPKNWATCDGQLLPIAQNTALFSLLGTYYGGNGTTTFALPDFRGAFPMHQGQGPGLTPRSIGEISGQETVTLISSEMPAHTHAVVAGTASPVPGPDAALPGASPARPYGPGPANATANVQMLQPVGGAQPHNNMPPYLVLNFCIALYGIFPPRS
jgi:microcystin-dependent protein